MQFCLRTDTSLTTRVSTLRELSTCTPTGRHEEPESLGVDKVIFFGLQHALKTLNESFEAFFEADVDEVCAEYQAFLDSFLGPNAVGTEHIRALHNLGYLPLEIKALPEGTRVPLRVPMLTVENTKPEFFWLTNYLETILSANVWIS